MTATVIDMSLYSSTQDALDNATQDTADGNIFEYPDGWTETLTGALTTGNFTLIRYQNGLKFRSLPGRTCDIDCGGFSFWNLPTIEGVSFEGIKFSNSAGPLLNLDRFCYVYDCEFSDVTNDAVEFSVPGMTDGSVVGCWFRDIGGNAILRCRLANNCLFSSVPGEKAMSRACYYVQEVTRCLFYFGQAGTDLFSFVKRVSSCSVWTDSINSAFFAQRPIFVGPIQDNIIEGFLGTVFEFQTTNETINGVFEGNGFFNNSVKYEAGHEMPFTIIDDYDFASSPFAKTSVAANTKQAFLDFFEPQDIAGINRANGITRGALQLNTGGGGSPAAPTWHSPYRAGNA